MKKHRYHQAKSANDIILEHDAIGVTREENLLDIWNSQGVSLEDFKIKNL